ncbi:MAG: glycoside hydrolase family 3 C-terminal domain-containing protein, partial [Oscillospiraceae bacterium]|nr:glycoside hydrolase family 3 C-terminal domain-containing protein [Oscillospiraceae bacterium]
IAGEWSEHPAREAVLAAENSAAVIMIMGLNALYEGEESDAYNGTDSGDKIDLELPAVQKRLYEEIKKTNKPIVFVNVTGSCVNLTRQNEECGAVVQCFYPGAEGGRALADILFGNVCPSGRLPVTFYKSADDLPAFEDYGMENRTYRYFKGEPLYKFGHGLSYTKFEIENAGGRTRVKNIGDYDGATVVTRYENGRLAGFRRVFLKKGEEKIMDELFDTV